MKSDTPITDEAYFKKSRTMYDLAGEMKNLERELNKAKQEIDRLDVAGIHSCHDNCQRLPCVLRRERDEARRFAEKYRNLSCDSQDEADETLLPWETTNQNEQ